MRCEDDDGKQSLSINRRGGGPFLKVFGRFYDESAGEMKINIAVNQGGKEIWGEGGKNPVRKWVCCAGNKIPRCMSLDTAGRIRWT
jgi:hypothetical protein